MPKVAFTQNIQRHVACPETEVEGSTVREALEAFFAANPRARSYVLDDQAALRKHMTIFVDGRAIRDRTRLSPPDVAELGIARTFQNVALFRGMSVLDNLMTGRLLKMRGHFLLDALWWGPARREELANRAQVERIIDFLEIQAIRKTPAGKLPYGLQKRVELGRALAAEPRLLLLDEPMAGMNVEEKEDMSRFILDVNSEFGTTIALIEHDMGVVMDISDRVVVLDYGRKIAEGPPEQVRKDPAVLNAYLGTAHD